MTNCGDLRQYPTVAAGKETTGNECSASVVSIAAVTRSEADMWHKHRKKLGERARTDKRLQASKKEPLDVILNKKKIYFFVTLAKKQSIILWQQEPCLSARTCVF